MVSEIRSSPNYKIVDSDAPDELVGSSSEKTQEVPPPSPLSNRVSPLRGNNGQNDPGSDLISPTEASPTTRPAEASESTSSGSNWSAVARRVLFVGLVAIGAIAVVFLLAYPPTTAFALIGLLGVYYGAVIGGVFTMPGLDGPGSPPSAQNNPEKPESSQKTKDEEKRKFNDSNDVKKDLNELKDLEEVPKKEDLIHLDSEIIGSDIEKDELISENSPVSPQNEEGEKSRGLVQWFRRKAAELQEKFKGKVQEKPPSESEPLTISEEDDSFRSNSSTEKTDGKKDSSLGLLTDVDEKNELESLNLDSESELSKISSSSRPPEKASKGKGLLSRISSAVSNLWSGKEEPKASSQDPFDSLLTPNTQDTPTNHWFFSGHFTTEDGQKIEITECPSDTDFVDDFSDQKIDPKDKKEDKPQVETSPQVRPTYVSAKVLPPSPPPRKYIPVRAHEPISSKPSKGTKKLFDDFFESVKTSDDIDLEGEELLRKLDSTAQAASEMQRKLDEIGRDKDNAERENRLDKWQTDFDSISEKLKKANEESVSASDVYTAYNEAKRKGKNKPLLSLF